MPNDSPVLLETRASEECGCPEEIWLVGGATTTIHLELDGSIHCFMDTGDNSTEMDFHSFPSLDAGRQTILGWAIAMLFAKRGWG